MKFADWWHRHFTRLGRDIAWRERYARRHGHAYPGHVPPRPMPATVEPDQPWPRVPRPAPWPPAPPASRPVGPMSLAERAARFQRGMEVVHSLSPECLRTLREDGRILSNVASRVTEAPPPPRAAGCICIAPGDAIFAVETIPAGLLIHIIVNANGTFAARKARHV